MITPNMIKAVAIVFGPFILIGLAIGLWVEPAPPPPPPPPAPDLAAEVARLGDALLACERKEIERLRAENADLDRQIDEARHEAAELVREREVKQANKVWKAP